MRILHVPNPAFALGESFRRWVHARGACNFFLLSACDMWDSRTSKPFLSANPLTVTPFALGRYAGITGIPEFLSKALAFAYGEDCAPLKEGRVAATQTLSGTGACRIAAEFYARFLPEGTFCYVSDPTWPNHIPIFQTAGIEVGARGVRANNLGRWLSERTAPIPNKSCSCCVRPAAVAQSSRTQVRKYPYLTGAGSLDLDGWLSTIRDAPAGSIFVVHACAHNPSGVDPTPEQVTCTP